MNKTKVYPWWQVASDIATADGYDDAALEALSRSLFATSERYGEDAGGATGGFRDRGELDCDPLQVAARTDLGRFIYREIKEGKLHAYDQTGRLVGIDEVQAAGIRLQGICVEPENVNEQLNDAGYLDVWHPDGQQGQLGAACEASRIDTVASSLSDGHSEQTTDNDTRRPAVTKHKLKRRSRILDAEIQNAKVRAIASDDTNSVWAELIKMADDKQGSLIGQSSDGLQYKGKKYQDTGIPDVFTSRALRDRMRRDKQR